MGWLLALPVDALLSPPSSSMHGASRQSTSPLWPAKRAIEPNNLFGISTSQNAQKSAQKLDRTGLRAAPPPPALRSPRPVSTH